MVIGEIKKKQKKHELASDFPQMLSLHFLYPQTNRKQKYTTYQYT